MTKQGRVVFSAMEEVVFGRPAAEAVAELAGQAGAERIFLMVSGTLQRETDEIARIRAALGNKVAAVFDRMPAHTPRQAVVAATAMAREAGADLIVTVGGGSVTDAAKAVQLCLANGVDHGRGDRRAARRAGRRRRPTPPALVRQIAVPTTLSAGEFSAISGVTNEATKVKEMLRHPRIIPVAVVLDPALTRHTPEWLFLSTGIRAVDHCVEGICSAEAHPFADAQALRGLALLVDGMQRVKADPGDLDARLDCQLGSWLSMAPLATGVPMGASHGIGYVLGAAFGVPHGHTSCIMLPAVMRWNRAGGWRTAGAGCRRDGRAGRRGRRPAGRVHRRARDAAQPGRGAGRPGCLPADRRGGDADALGAAQPTADRRAGAGDGDPGTGGLRTGGLARTGTR